jgi:hypothetical protein
VKTSNLPSLRKGFNVARLWVRLDWHVQQAWLAADAEHGNEAERVWYRLAREAPGAMTEDAGHSIHDDLMSEFGGWKFTFGSPPYRAARQETLAVLNRAITTPQCSMGPLWPQGVDYQHVPALLRDEACRAFLAPVRDRMDGIRERIRAALDAEAQDAWDLGECIEQGVHPLDVYRHMQHMGRHLLASPLTGQALAFLRSRIEGPTLAEVRQRVLGAMQTHGLWLIANRET